jgi:hypothetical protein
MTKSKEAPAQRRRIDLQDALLVLGIALFESGVAAIYWPAALILGGVMCLFLTALIERTKPKK